MITPSSRTRVRNGKLASDTGGACSSFRAGEAAPDFEYRFPKSFLLLQKGLRQLHGAKDGSDVGVCLWIIAGRPHGQSTVVEARGPSRTATVIDDDPAGSSRRARGVCGRRSRARIRNLARDGPLLKRIRPGDPEEEVIHGSILELREWRALFVCP